MFILWLKRTLPFVYHPAVEECRTAKNVFYRKQRLSHIFKWRLQYVISLDFTSHDVVSTFCKNVASTSLGQYFLFCFWFLINLQTWRIAYEVWELYVTNKICKFYKCRNVHVHLKRGSRFEAHAAKTLRWRIKQLQKCLKEKNFPVVVIVLYA